MNIESGFHFVSERANELFLRIGEHLMLTSASTIVAVVTGVAVGVIAYQNTRWRNVLLAAVGILQTIPGLAMLVLLMTIFGRIGVLPALVALTLYALLPIVRNTLTGLSNVSAPLMLAAEGLGMTKSEQLVMVRLPLAMPYIMSGIRTATVTGVGLATLAAFVGGGGLGEFINRGLALSNSGLILLGAIPAAILAILADLSLAVAEWGIKPASHRPAETEKESEAIGNKNWSDAKLTTKLTKKLAVLLPFALGLASLLIFFVGHAGRPATAPIRVGSKHFVEQIVLGEMLAQLIEAKTKLPVERRLGLGGTLVCHSALVNNEIDLYPEYSGTALLAVMHHATISDPITVLNTVSDYYQSQLHLRWLKPFGFENSWALLVLDSNPRFQSIRSISDLHGTASFLTAGFPTEFSERADGYPGLSKCYQFSFASIKDFDPNLAYLAVAKKQVDVSAGNSTDGRISAFKLRILNDDKKFFPPYQAATVVSEKLLATHPEIGDVVNLLAGQIDNTEMQKLNFKVDSEKRSPADVVKEFLEAKHLVP